MITTLLGPNRFAKVRELHKLLDDKPSTRIYPEDGLKPWLEEVGQAGLFGDAISVVGERIVEDLAPDIQGELGGHLSVHKNDENQLILFLVDNEEVLKKSPLAELLLSGKVLRFPEPTEAQVVMWLGKEAEILGIEIDRPASVALVTKYAGDQFAIKTELSRWANLANPKINRSDVEAMVPLQTDVSNFDVVNSWAARQAPRALSQLERLRRQGVFDQAIIGSLAWKIESLLMQSSLKGGWSRDRLVAAMERLYELDLNIKSGGIDSSIGLELWIVDTING